METQVLYDVEDTSSSAAAAAAASGTDRQPHAAASTAAGPAVSQPQPPPSARGWPKVVGQTIVFAFATRPGFTGDLISEGDSVTCRREEPAAAASVLKWKSSGKGGGKKGKGKRKSVPPGDGGGWGGAGRPPFSGKSKQKDVVVRFYNPSDREVGRLPAETSRWMAPLLDEGVIEVAGVCVDCPSPRISTMDQILLQLCVQIPYAAPYPVPLVTCPTTLFSKTTRVRLRLGDDIVLTLQCTFPPPNPIRLQAGGRARARSAGCARDHRERR